MTADPSSEPARSGRPLPRAFFDDDVRTVARSLLHKVVVGPGGRGRVVEVEAYGGREDPGSHAYRGPTPRTEVMHGPPGHLYVYFSYGMHWCANVVCGPDGSGAAVLIRALEPLGEVGEMFARRSAARAVTDLCSGPAKLCQALAIDGTHNGVDLTDPTGPVWVADDGTRGPTDDEVSTSARIGLSRGRELPWRWFVADNPHVSRR